MEESRLPEEEAPGPVPVAGDAWKPVVMGQVSGDLFPRHPEPPEAPLDELTEAALNDPANVAHQEGDSAPTFWRVLVVVLIAVAALAIVFRIGR